jgi:hypothetical protein
VPLLVQIETETGVMVADAVDVRDVLVSLAEQKEVGQLAVAHVIDPLGNTVFNRLQIPLLLQDIEALSSGASPKELGVLERIADLATRALAERHLYLKFYGD